MKIRFASVIIALCALLSLPAVAGAGYSPDGTAVTNEAEFLAMQRSGEYYLASDITLTSSYQYAFTGTLNGNGKTLTVSAPVFKQFNGTVRDLTIEGSIETNTACGALATATAGMTAWNVTNGADIKSSGGTYVGGLVGSTRAGATAEFYGCVNNGNIECLVASSGVYAGGLVGYCDRITAVNCRNTGDITALSGSADVGGIVGHGVYSVGRNDAYFCLCSNSGNLTSGKNAGGISGYLGCANNSADRGYSFRFCENNGTVKGTTYVGGIAGYGYGTDSEKYIFYACVNNGTVISGNAKGGFASQFFAYCNQNYSSLQYCLGTGKLEANPDSVVYFCICGVSSQRPAANPQTTDNFLAEDRTEWFTYALDDSNAAGRMKLEAGIERGAFTKIDPSTVPTGEAVMTVNRRAGVNLFYQNLSEGGAPSVFPGSGIVVYDPDSVDDVLINGPEPQLPLYTDYGVPTDEKGWYEETQPAVTEPEQTLPEPQITTVQVETEEQTGPAASGKGCASFSAGLTLAALPAALSAAVYGRKKRKAR